MAGTRILLIEDNAINMELMLYMLRAWGHDVVTATDAAQGLAMARANPPQRILSDVQLPGMDGYEFARIVKADPQLRQTPVVMLTSSREESDLVRSYELGVNAFVVKPVGFREFFDAIQDLGVFWAILNEPPPRPTGG